jgi:hypothetical protein
MTPVTGWKNSQWPVDNKMSCISLIEVADLRHRVKLITGGITKDGVNVAMDHSLVVTRYLFFYPNGPDPQFPNSAPFVRHLGVRNEFKPKEDDEEENNNNNNSSGEENGGRKKRKKDPLNEYGNEYGEEEREEYDEEDEEEGDGGAGYGFGAAPFYGGYKAF